MSVGRDTAGACHSGDDARFAELYARWYRPIWEYCSRRVAADAVDDAVADTFLAVWRRLDGFNRQVGTFSGHHVSPAGTLITDAEWHANVPDWLSTDDDRRHVQSLMVGVDEAGRIAGWVAAPSSGIHQKPVDFEYVKI